MSAPVGAVRRILIVDDDPETLEFLRAEVQDPAIEVIVATDGEEATELAWRLKPQVILLDLALPKKGGFEVFIELRKASFAPRIVLLTAALPELLALGRELGAFACVRKPIGEDLRTLVHRALGLPGAGPARGKRRLLVAEDDPDTAETLRLLLDHPSIAIEFVSDGLEALRRVESGAPDAALLDLRLPILDGLEAFARLKAAGARFPIILMSAGTGPEVTRRASELGAFATLQKPFDLEKLSATIRAALGIDERQAPAA